MVVLWGVLIVTLIALAIAMAYYRVMHPGVMVLGSGDTRIACVGDSITYGLGVLGRRRRKSYPACLLSLLGSRYTLINYGVSDQSLLSNSDKPYFSERTGKKAWNPDADIVLFMLGSNDSKIINWNPEAFRKELGDTLRHYRALGVKHLFVMSPPKIFTSHPGKKSCNEEILHSELRPIVACVAKEQDIPCIDLYAVTLQHSEWFPDTIHPNGKGNLAIAEEILKALKQSGAVE